MLTYPFLFFMLYIYMNKKKEIKECLDNIFTKSVIFMSNLFVNWGELFTPFVGLNRTVIHVRCL